MLSEAQLIALAMMIIGAIALILTREKDQAVTGQQAGEKDRSPAMKTARA